MEYKFEELDLDKYELDDAYSNLRIYVKKEEENINDFNNQNTVYYKNNLSDSYIDYAEAIASIICKATIRNCCDAKLTKINTNSTWIYGVSSYLFTRTKDKILYPADFLSDYYKKMNYDCDELNRKRCNIKKAIDGIKYVMLEKEKRPYSEFEAVKQQFIDMIMFDCKFGNYDRHLDNWRLYKDGDTGEIRLYPLYDNEAILGLDNNIDKENKNDLEEKCNDVTFKTFVPSDSYKLKSDAESVISYLMDAFPKETRKSYMKLKRFSKENMKNLLEEFVELPQNAKEYAYNVFICREKIMENTLKKAINKIEEKQQKIQ